MTDHLLARSPIPAAHQSAAPWLATLAAADVWPLAAVPTRRWLRVERGCLWVTAAAGQPGPVPREADIWLTPGDSLVLPPDSRWLLQAWPDADVMLMEQAVAPLPRRAATHHPRLAGLRVRLVGWACALRGLLSAVTGRACSLQR